MLKSPESRLIPTNILIIEDNPGDVELVREMLTESEDDFSFNLTWAERLSTGLDLLAQRDFDVILLDFSLPDSHGLETLFQVRAASSEAAIIVLTGIVDELVLGIRAVQSGAQDYLVKGQVDNHLLLRTLRYAMERRQIDRELEQYRNHLEGIVEARTVELTDANEALRQQIIERQRIEEKLRQITDNMLDIIYQTDVQGIIEYASPSVFQVLGYQPEKFLGRSIYAGIHPDDVELAKEAIKTEGKAEFRYRHFDGHILWLETLSKMLVTEDGDAQGIVFASRDVTHRRQFEIELQELNRLKTEFISTAAHELRTPLTAILGFSEILLTRELDAMRSRRYMEIIREQSLRLSKLVDMLLDISRLESKGKLILEMQSVNLAELVTKAIVPFDELTIKHQFQIEGMLEVMTVIGDPFRLGQVLQNLISNAVKYSPAGGTVTIEGQMQTGFIQISVRDEGIGMTDEQQKHLFERFYRADASNLTISGTGLGLSICKLIVELHDGKIWIESKSGIGSTVYFKLPAA